MAKLLSRSHIKHLFEQQKSKKVGAVASNGQEYQFPTFNKKSVGNHEKVRKGKWIHLAVLI
jgi:hypothetical protein